MDSLTKLRFTVNPFSPAYFSTNFVGESPILVTSRSLSLLSVSLCNFGSLINIKELILIDVTFGNIVFLIYMFLISFQWFKVRDFIRAALYDPEHGYFSQRSDSVGVLDRGIKFNQLNG